MKKHTDNKHKHQTLVDLFMDRLRNNCEVEQRAIYNESADNALQAMNFDTNCLLGRFTSDLDAQRKLVRKHISTLGKLSHAVHTDEFKEMVTKGLDMKTNFQIADNIGDLDRDIARHRYLEISLKNYATERSHMDDFGPHL